MSPETTARATSILSGCRDILIFTGAGISTESGIPDFRGPEGLWTKVDPDDFNIDRYIADPELRARSWEMHLAGSLWGARSKATPNQGHIAIRRLADAGLLAGVITQNVDGLHGKSGLEDDFVAELHGNVRESHCLSCGTMWPTETILTRVDAGTKDPHCECGGLIKTRTVMFGQMLPERELLKAEMFLSIADSILVLGSTVSVWPAADLVIRGSHHGLPLVIINKGETEADHLAAVKIDEAIGTSLPPLVDELLRSIPGGPGRST